MAWSLLLILLASLDHPVLLGIKACLEGDESRSLVEDSASPGCFLLVGLFIDPLSVMSVLSYLVFSEDSYLISEEKWA